MGIAEYLARHPSENDGFENKIKPEELWNSWFTINGITRNQLASESGMPFTKELAKEIEVTKTKKTPFKQIAALVQSSQ